MTQNNPTRRRAEKQGVKPLMDQASIFERAVSIVQRKGNFNNRLTSDFDLLIQEIEQSASGIYMKEENRYGKEVLLNLIENNRKDGITDEQIFLDHEREIAAFYLSLIQGRKNRAGKTLEKIIGIIFCALGYPYDDQVNEVDGKPDFILPSHDYYVNNPLNSIVFTSKRKLRERWRQIVTEGMRGIGYYLATIDEELSEPELKKMVEQKVFVICPKVIKNRCYPDASNVLSYEQFFEEHLQPKVKIWKREGQMSD